jgi:hypothetical protein
LHGRALAVRNISVRKPSGSAVIVFEGVPTGGLSIANVTGDLNGTAVTRAPLTIYINQGDVFPLEVSRVYATTPTPPAGLIGLYSFA